MKQNILEALTDETLGLENNPDRTTLNTKSHTVSLYKSVTNLIYKDLVQVNDTETRLANVFCWEHIDNKGNLIVNTPATYSGKFGRSERDELISGGNVYPTKKDYVVEEYFIDDNDIVYQALKDNPFTGINENTDTESLYASIIEGNVRYVSDGSNNDGFEPTDSSFNLRSWRGKVTTRRTKLDITIEAMQDLQRSVSGDAEQSVIDSIAMVISDDINKDIIHKLLCISKRYKSQKYDNKSFVDLSTDIRDGYVIGRDLYSMITDMTAYVTSQTKFTPTYVVTSPRVAGMINSSGMSVADGKKRGDIQDRYVLNDGTIMLVDVTAKFDYIMVGVKNSNASSLYMSNFVHKVDFEDDDKNTKEIAVGTYNVFRVTNPNSLSDSYMCHSRYALTSPPYTYSDDESDSKIVHGDDWVKMANNSPLSMMIGIKLPSIEG